MSAVKGAFHGDSALKEGVIAQLPLGASDYDGLPPFENALSPLLGSGRHAPDELNEMAKYFGLHPGAIVLVACLGQSRQQRVRETLEAIPTGADTLMIAFRWLIAVLERIASTISAGPVRNAADRIIATHRQAVLGKPCERATWRKLRQEMTTAMKLAPSAEGAMMVVAAWDFVSFPVMLAELWDEWRKVARAVARQSIGWTEDDEAIWQRLLIRRAAYISGAIDAWNAMNLPEGVNPQEYLSAQTTPQSLRDASSVFFGASQKRFEHIYGLKAEMLEKVKQRDVAEAREEAHFADAAATIFYEIIADTALAQ